MERESAEIIAIEALGFLAAEPERLKRFLAVSGANPDDLRRNAGDPWFLAGVLDYLLEDESLLFLFSESRNLVVDAPGKARAALPGGARWEP